MPAVRRIRLLALHRLNARDLLQFLHHGAELLWTRNLQRRRDGGTALARLGHGRHLEHVDLHPADDAHYVGQQPRAVHRLDDDRRAERRVGAQLLRPLHGDGALRLLLQQVRQIRAVGAMDDHAPAPADVAHQRITRQRITAVGKLGEHPVQPRDAHTHLRLVSRYGRRRRLGGLRGSRSGRKQALTQLRHDDGGPQLLAADGCQQRILVRLVECLRQPFEVSFGQLLVALAQTERLQLAIQPLAPYLDVYVALVLLEVAQNAVARGLGPGDVQPIAGGVGIFALENLHHIAALQLIIQRDELLHQTPGAIVEGDAGAGDMVADVSVDEIGEIERCGPGRQLFHVAVGREDKDLLLVEYVAFHGFDRTTGRLFAGRLKLLLPLLELPHPALERARLGGGAVAYVFVVPVHRDAILRHLMHLVRTDLDFGQTVVQAEDGRMQRLVAIRLGRRDEVLDAPVFGSPQPVDMTEREVAVCHSIYEDAEGEHIIEIREVVAAAALHLLVNAPQMLDTARHFGAQADGSHLVAQDVD